MSKSAAQVLFGVFSFCILFLSIINFLVYFIKPEPVLRESNKVTTNYWEGIINQYPTYSDAYWELAKEQEKLGKDRLVESLKAKAEVLGEKTEK